MELVKLTKLDGTTYGGFLWMRGRSRVIPPRLRRPTLCSRGVFHAYLGVEQALLLNPRQANYQPPCLWAAEAPEIVATDGTKVGVYELTLGNDLPLPTWWVDKAQRRRVQIRFAVLCARAVLPLYNDRYPEDERPRRAIETAEDCLVRAKVSRAAEAAAGAARAAIDIQALGLEAVRLEATVPA